MIQTGVFEPLLHDLGGGQVEEVPILLERGEITSATSILLITANILGPTFDLEGHRSLAGLTRAVRALRQSPSIESEGILVTDAAELQSVQIGPESTRVVANSDPGLEVPTELVLGMLTAWHSIRRNQSAARRQGTQGNPSH
ncbi:MAG TPA: hypothetical protein VLG47_07550 [Candidatus Saccharimonadales bacterium]|nr:hypothetical protein [Candidatus Saccharimonadales bacterium]